MILGNHEGLSKAFLYILSTVFIYILGSGVRYCT